MKVLFFFLDGVGLGLDDPQINPFAKAEMPALKNLLDGRGLLRSSCGLESQRASLVALDARLDVSGIPQSATGQATLLCGRNIAAALGYHYGPKPNPQISRLVQDGNLFLSLKNSGGQSALLNAYPASYFSKIESSQRLFSVIPLAAASAGIPLRTAEDLHAGLAIAADFTAQGWREHLGLLETPVITPFEAGRRLARLTDPYHLSFFEYWLSDYAGHWQNMSLACQLLQTLDQVLDGLLESWDDEKGLILLTSDHGNLEDLSTRHHTLNAVPALVIGTLALRRAFIKELRNLSDVGAAILDFLHGT